MRQSRVKFIYFTRMRCYLRLIFSFVFLTMFPVLASASPGQLDTAFGVGGLVRQNIATAPDDSSADKVLRQADGRLVVAGSCRGEVWHQICLVRYTAQDVLDISFNGSGKRFIAFPSDAYLRAIVELDAKLYVLGFCGGSACLFRLNNDGTTDVTFGTAGVVTAFAGMSPSALAVQGTQLVLAGSCPVNTSAWQCVLRISASGLPDTSFGSNGLVTTNLGIGDSAAAAVAISGEKIIVAGNCVFRNNGGSGPTFSTIRDICVTRYNQNGSLDGNFNGSGTGHYFVTNGHHWIVGVALDGDRIVVGATCDASPISIFQNPRVYCAVRALATGGLDASFDGDGRVSLQLDNSYSQVAAVGLDGSRVVLAGNCQSTGSIRMCVVRFNEDGSLDASLSGNGVLRAAGAANGGELGNALLIDGNRIVLAGECTTDSGRDFCVARYNRNGTPDSTFGTGGREGFALGVKPLQDIASALAYQPDGKLVVVGYCRGDTVDQVCVARFNVDGSLDLSFNGTGRIVTALGGTARGHALMLSDGKITVAAECTSPTVYNYDFCVLRFNADGSPDTGFGSNGLARVAIGPSHDYPASITLDNGRILINGRC
ncbi:MAG: hypothetical protein JNN20_17735, partial [Betaproteobacteria bacterium]|nr:hypothetical protein [Betaproteobacteria bacterium]